MKKKPYPLWLGGIAASVAGLCTHPLDLTKVRMQVAGDKGLLLSMRKTVANEGILGLWGGGTGTLLRQMTYSMMRFAIYDTVKAKIHTDSSPMPVWKLVAAGSVAGSVSAGICNPGEIIMVRMQGDKAKPVEKRYGYRNSIQGLYRMAREEGLATWYKGVGPNVVRGLTMNVFQIGGYDVFKAEIIKNNLLADGPVCHFMASFAAATAAATACAPADVMKSLVMSSQGAGPGVFTLIKDAYANHGVKFFFRGWTPAWIRLQPTTIITFLVLEQLKGGVDRYRKTGGTLM
ncbi:mitochondrial carrier domain-containing protein [Dioszegia hungarica]|uniref:Mitochondrial carrier domain-containing protein n=1 Tax=Dioszegia hungarica TaxID=4972 RepID=A0AA38LUB6_9TREE|nr:mitochondrial carrier domain-containing protein [Dioszegia hungarica]KAI9633646.1 mitochondrial carrier domain-containing protein [Dioszegia hungarica]